MTEAVPFTLQFSPSLSLPEIGDGLFNLPVFYESPLTYVESTDDDFGFILSDVLGQDIMPLNLGQLGNDLVEVLMEQQELSEEDKPQTGDFDKVRHFMNTRFEDYKDLFAQFGKSVMEQMLACCPPTLHSGGGPAQLMFMGMSPSAQGYVPAVSGEALIRKHYCSKCKMLMGIDGYCMGCKNTCSH